MRTRTENACSTRLIRSDGCAVCTCTYRKHAACIRRYFACVNDSAGVRMRNRTHIACAARFRTVVVTLVSRVVSKMYAMANMVLILCCSCHAIRRRAHDLSVCGCAYGHMVHRRLRDCLYMYLRAAVRACGVVLASTLRLRHRCVATARRILCVAWMLEYLAARHSSCLCLSMRAFVLCLCAIEMRDSVVCRSSVS